MYMSNNFVKLTSNQKIDVNLFLETFIFNSYEDGSLSYLPIGTIIFNTLVQLIKSEMDKIGAQEIIMPSLVSEKSIFKSKRVKIGFFKKLGIYIDFNQQKYYLMPTNEETMAYLIGKYIEESGFDQKIYYQIGKKYRNEKIPQFPIRLTEFFMQDVYSFSKDEFNLNESYDAIREAYENVFKTLRLEYYITEGEKDPLFKDFSQEVVTAIPDGNNFFEIIDGPKKVVKKNSEESQRKNLKRGLEIAHIYKLFKLYSSFFVSEKCKGILMGGYGLGIERVIYSTIAQNFNQGTINWPDSLIPFKMMIISEDKSFHEAKNVYNLFKKEGISVLLEDRKLNIEEKIKISKLLGIPFYLIIDSNKTCVFNNTGIKLTEISLDENFSGRLKQCMQS